ncbi:MAG: chemotaxis protein CheY [Myxococcaceae bacterium]|nr:chemotaxis protein CheY [Myxococcaceae bacterium]
MPNKRSSILVVEDDADLQEAMAELLQEHGFAVLVASNGREGLAKLREHSGVRAILLDVEMPVMCGATFRGEQQEDPAIASVPLVVLTGREDYVPLARSMSADAWVQKPFTPEALLRVVDRYR